MARFTPVYADFILRLEEVALLRKKAGALERSVMSLSHGHEIRALCRGAVVLLSSHIEAYIKELGEHTLDALYNKAVSRSKFAPQFFYYLSRDRIETIRSSSQPEKIAEHVQLFVSLDASNWGSTGGLPTPISSENFSRGFSNPSFDKVKAYFGRFGYSEFRRDYLRVLGGLGNTSIAKLDQIVDTRNSIAHGDPSATKTPAEVKDMEVTAKLFCRTADKVFSDWCRETLCSIR